MSQLRIYAHADTAGDWYPKQALNQFKTHSRAVFVNNPVEADLIWIFSYYLSLRPFLAFPELLGFSKRRRHIQNIPIITTLHHLSPYKKKLWQTKINILNKLTDYWHVPAERSRQQLTSLLTKPIISLPYWVDTKQFFPLSSSEKQRLHEKYSIPKSKIIIGSFQRDTEADLVSPKLEKGPDIFCDCLEQLDRNSIFILLSGVRRNYVEQRFKKAGIAFLNVGTVPFNELNNLYNILDYYLIMSRIEGGPQAILEAMATKTKIFSTDVGISNLLSPEVIVKDAAEAAKKIKQSYPEVIEKHYATAIEFDSKEVISKYDDSFRKLISK